MPKRFITELDILDLSRDGKQVLEVDEDTVLTDLAHEKIKVFGIQLIPRQKEPVKTLIQPVSAPATTVVPAMVKSPVVAPVLPTIPLPVDKSPVSPPAIPTILPPISPAAPLKNESVAAPEQKHAPCSACALKMKMAAESGAPVLDNRVSEMVSNRSVLHERLRAAIQAKLGNQLESEFIDKIIFRSLKAAGLE